MAPFRHRWRDIGAILADDDHLSLFSVGSFTSNISNNVGQPLHASVVSYYKSVSLTEFVVAVLTTDK